MSIEDLFREKLENTEIMPETSVNANLMRKLGRKEFMSFIPGKFNIYYAGLIAAAAIAVGLLLISGHKDEESNVKSPKPGTEMVEPMSIPSGRTVKIESEPIVSSANKVIIIEEEKVSESHAEQVQAVVKEESTSPPALMTSSLPENTIFNSEKKGPGKLQAKTTGNDALFEPSAVSGCAPLKVHFKNLATSYVKFSWSFGDGGYSDKMEPDWIFDEEGDYTVVMNATDANGRRNSWTVPIKVHSKPKANFEISPENAILPIDEIRFSNYSSGASAYEWSFGDGKRSSDFEPSHKYLKYGNYDISLTVTSENGCSDKLVIEDAFSGSEFFIEMPNAFIPNPHGPSGGVYSSKSDESAEVFHPSFSGVTEYKMNIYSKIGILLFESSDINIGWDGYFKGQLCNPGVYIWKIRGNFSNGEPFTKMGDVTLLRN